MYLRINLLPVSDTLQDVQWANTSVLHDFYLLKGISYVFCTKNKISVCNPWSWKVDILCITCWWLTNIQPIPVQVSLQSSEWFRKYKRFCSHSLYMVRTHRRTDRRTPAVPKVLGGDKKHLWHTCTNWCMGAQPCCAAKILQNKMTSTDFYQSLTAEQSRLTFCALQLKLLCYCLYLIYIYIYSEI